MIFPIRMQKPGRFRGLARNIAKPTLRFALKEMNADAEAYVGSVIAAVLKLDAEVRAARAAASDMPTLDAQGALDLSGARVAVSPEGAPVAISSQMTSPTGRKDK